MKDKIEIPFGAHDSELKGWEYTIPEGFTAEIKDGKVIVKEKANEDERMRKMLIDRVRSANELTDELREWILTYLEKQKINIEGDFGRGYDCGYEACLNSHGAEWFEKQKEKSEKLIIPEKENEAMKAIESIIRVYGKTQGEWIAGYDMDTLVVHLRKAFAALEKQKEIPMSDSTKMIKMWDEEKKILERMYLRGDTWRLIAYNAFIDGIARGNLVKFEKQKEQKPDSLIYDKDLDKDAREFYLSGGADSPVDSTGLVPIVRMAEFGATWMKERMEKEQKSAEWSEEDREMLTRCVAAIPVQGDEILPTSYLNKLRNWLESLPERFNLQPKQEWSEEDKDYYDTIVRKLEVIGDDSGLSKNQIKFLREHYPSHCSEWSEEDESFLDSIEDAISSYYDLNHAPQYHYWLEEKLKSIRPQPKLECDNETEIQKAYREGKNAGRKEVFDHPEEYGLQLRRMYDYETGKRNPEWSEEDKKFFNLLHASLYQMKVRIGKDEYDKAVERLKSLRPSWKPSDEQMQCLLAVITNQYNAGAESCHLTLGSLYNDLKKLI